MRNRYEATHWPDRPPWWAGVIPLLGPLWRRVVSPLSGKLNWAAWAAPAILFALALGGLGLLAFLVGRNGGGEKVIPGAAAVAICPSKATPKFDSPAELTFEEVSRRAEEAGSCPGYALHLHAIGDVDAGPYSSHNESEIWVDLLHKRGRVKYSSTLGSNELRGANVYAGSIAYQRQYYGDEQGQFKRNETHSCHGAERVVLELVISCGLVTQGALENKTFSIEQRTAFHGKNAIAFVRSGTSRGEDETYDTVERTYFDGQTFLPLGRTDQGTLDIGKSYPVNSDIPFQSEFVALSALPSDLFDPSSIGYVTTNFQQAIKDANLNIPVYWLGRELPGGSNFPSLVVDSVYLFGSAEPAASDGVLPQPVLRINYVESGGESAKASVTLRIYPSSIWESYRAGAGQEHGTEVDLAGGRAIVVRSGDSYTKAGHYYAAGYLGDVVVWVDAPLRWNDQRTPSESAYNSEAAVEHILNSLIPLQ